MAKIRRVIRKLKPTASQAFDDQLWPVLLALCVLGGFIMGSIIAYLRFDDPRWYANAITWLIVTVLGLGGAAVALAFVDNRVFRRSMQLAIILGLFFHCILLVTTVQLNIFERIFDVLLAENDMTETRQRTVVPEYFQAERREQQREEFERPVETETPQPEPTPEPIEREEVQEEETPREPQPTPVPEPEDTLRPNVVKREQPQETAPRYSEQRSRLSRRLTQTQPTPPSMLAEAAELQRSQARASELQAADASVARQETAAQTQRRIAAGEPSATQEHQTVQIARRESDQTPEAQSTATPTARRPIDRAVTVPRTEVELADTPATSQRTDPNELRPRTTLAHRQTTTSPDRTRADQPPVPDAATPKTNESQRRQLRTEERPAIAQTPASVPNRRTRVTPRPDLATAAADVSPGAMARPQRQEPTLVQATTSPIRRTHTPVDVRRRTVADEPPTASQQNAARIARRQTRQIPTDSTNVADTLTPRRQERRPTVGSSTSAEVTRPAPVANDSRANRLQPTATTASRQATPSAAVARAASQPSPRVLESTPAPEIARSATRQPRAETAPAIAQAVRSRPNRSAQPAVQPSTSSMAANVMASATPTAEAASAAPQAVAGTVGRRQAEIQLRRPIAAAEPAGESEPGGTSPSARRQAADTPAAQPSAPAVAVTTPRRQIGHAAITPNATAQAAGAAAAVAATSAAAGPTARSTPAVRQATAASAAGLAGGGPTVAAPDSAAAAAAATGRITRRQTVAAPAAVAAASAPSSTPRRQTTTPSIAPSTAADSVQMPSVASAASDGSGQMAASPTATARQATASAVAERGTAQPSMAAPTTEAVGGVSRPATRMPRGGDAPNTAQARVSSLARRQSTIALPSATTVTADVAANLAPTRGTAAQPRPSSATVARQAASNPSATRSQQSHDVQSASTSTEIARATARRAASTGAPSIIPDASFSRRPARTDMQSAIEASPANVESPAVAEATRGTGNPAASPARTSLSKAVTGVAGVGRGRNLDRANPAADSPAMIASASARRAESVQNTPPGPALSPAAPALVRRSRAGADMPGASLQAEPVVQLATASGAQQPAELAANASAALSRKDASAAQAPTTGARGTTSVDLGPTRVVSEGGTARASGGGQPAMNFETDSPKIARNSNIGGAPLASIAATTVVDAPTAPPSDSGGRPATPETDMEATAVARTDAGGAEPVSGGPAKATQTGPPTEMSLAEEVAEAALSRAELAEALPGRERAGGGSDEEDEEEQRRRLARAASRLAVATTSATAEGADVAAAAASGQQSAAAAAATAVARNAAEADAGSPAAGPRQMGPTGESSSQVATEPIRRAEVPEGTPEGPAVLSMAANALGRSAVRSVNPATMTQVEPVDMTAAAVGGGPGTAEPTASRNTAIARADTSATGSAAAGDAGSVNVETSDRQATPARGTRATGRVDAPAVTQGDDSSQVARSSRLGAMPVTAIAAATVMPADAGAAGANDAEPGGEQMAGPESMALARSDVVGAGSVTGGPAEPVAGGAAEAAQAISPATVSRVAATEAVPGEAVAGGGQPETDASANLAHKIARRPGSGAPRLALAGPNPTSAATAPAADLAAGGGAAGSPLSGADVNPDASATERSTGGGAPAGGRPSYLVEAGPAGGASGGDLLAAAQFTRAESVEGAIGSPQVGGGTARPTRSAAGPSFAADARADTIALAGAPGSGGMTDGSPIAALGTEAARLPGGAHAIPDYGPVGASGGETIVDVQTPGNPGRAIGTRSSSPSTDQGPAVGQTANRGAPFRRSSLTQLPTGTSTVAMVDVPSPSSLAPVAQATADHGIGDATGAIEMSRQSTEGGLAVNIDAPVGAGGLGSSEYAVNVGVNDRRARNESVQVQVRSARFVRQHVGGLPDFSTTAVVATEPFRRRTGRIGPGGVGGGNGAPPPQTEETIELGLAWLARHQLPDGSWSLQGINGERAALVSDTAATGLALLAFQGAGYNHREHKYADVVNAAVQYLLSNQKDDGDLFVPLDDESNRSVWFYSHSIALLALCEAYGMTQDPALREPVQKAIDFLVASQHPDRGGWRYRPGVGTDTSVTGWAMMALKSGELANLEVPEECYNKIRGWLDKSMASAREEYLYRYNPYAPNTPEQRHGRRASKTMTSVGLLMRMYLGWRRDNANLEKGAEYLAENLPSNSASERDTYYWYYATQVMFHMGGDYWKAWNGRLHPLLVNTQAKQGPMAGSWDPRSPVPDRWAPHAGRLYVTTMNLLSLEVYYRHLPLYEDYAR